MDYKGQRLNELIYYILIVVFGVVGWFWGYVNEDFMYTLKTWAVGTGLSVLLCVPDWPWYNTSPQMWLKKIPKKKTKAAAGGAADDSAAESGAAGDDKAADKGAAPADGAAAAAAPAQKKKKKKSKAT